MMHVLATAPAEITGLISDATSVWELAKDFILAVLVFTVLLKVAKKIRRA